MAGPRDGPPGRRDAPAVDVSGPPAAYGDYTHCLVCNRPLTDPESVIRGVGPSCWSRLLHPL
ncbi:DUF6011 domain-containing protein [Streptomyces sp. NPDC059352]|uniref:DUF6011 domain-containing protein n=1 Tax=Streptomyces sp. NPDC059352 TaxID=3346810 RepID=UPI0036887BDA